MATLWPVTQNLRVLALDVLQDTEDRASPLLTQPVYAAQQGAASGLHWLECRSVAASA